ncbi:MAG: hypothetical protein LUE14_05720 [Clostridiales bacterium]|nr:hypothetical protein [Clostridiales bacterium]
MKKKTIATMVLLGGCVAAALCFTGCGTTKIDLNDYVTVEFEGYDEYGTAKVTFDVEALDEDYSKKVKLTSLAEEWGDTSIGELIGDMTIVSVYPNDDLSNGDEVEVTWDVLSSFSGYVDGDIEVSHEDKTYTVSGLEEVGEADVFENVEVTFSGTAPDAEATVNVSGDLSASYFTVNPSSDLNIGDTVTVSVSESSVPNIIAATGTKPTEMSKEYEVTDVAYYVSSLDDIPEEALEKMQSQAEDDRAAAVVDWEDGSTFISMDLLGYYFLTPKEGYSGWDYNHNIIYLVYQINLNQMSTDMSYYWDIKYTDGIVLEDGTFSIDYSDYDIPLYGLFIGYDQCADLTSEDGTTMSHAGFEDLDSMFNYLVTKNIDDYTYESTVK